MMASRFAGTPLPKSPHIVLPELKPRTIIVGDIHGCLSEFQDLLHKCAYKKEDTTLILVGDLVNKGPYSADVVKYARALDAFAVRGNHDHAALYYACVETENRPELYNYVSQLSRLVLSLCLVILSHNSYLTFPNKYDKKR